MNLSTFTHKDRSVVQSLGTLPVAKAIACPFAFDQAIANSFGAAGSLLLQGNHPFEYPLMMPNNLGQPPDPHVRVSTFCRCVI